jgi:O-antigen/teichoic acid export membrane protein
MTLAARTQSAPAKNAVWSTAEYLSQPVILLCTAPALLRALGVEQFAIWLLATAAVTGGALVSNGFGDAGLKHLAEARGRAETGRIGPLVGSMLSLNLMLSAAFAAILCIAAPTIPHHLPQLTAAHRGLCRNALMLGAALLLIKAIENVFSCALRAHELYSTTTRITIIVRISAGIAALVAALAGANVLGLLCVTGLFWLAGAMAQVLAARRALQLDSCLPRWSLPEVRLLFGFGLFSWLQTFVGMLTQQADRFLVALLLGTQAVTYYTVSVQVTMPIHGIVAAALQVLFPYLGTRLATTHLGLYRRPLLTAFAFNALFVFSMAIAVTFFGRAFLARWMGADFAAHSTTCLTICAWSFALLGLNVTAFWALMALGQIRLLSIVNIAVAVAMLGAIAFLAPRFGVNGAAASRLLNGPITWLTFIPLLSSFNQQSATAGALRTCEDI